MKYFILMIALGFSASAFSQTDTSTFGYVHGTLIQTEIPAVFLGGDMIWKNYLRKNLRQPNTAGIVTVAFTVDVQGNCSDVEIIKSVNPDLDQEALRFIKKSSGYWVPAVQHGQHVRYRNRIDIEFQYSSG
jgi:TonB family protein